METQTPIATPPSSKKSRLPSFDLTSVQVRHLFRIALNRKPWSFTHSTKKRAWGECCKDFNSLRETDRKGLLVIFADGATFKRYHDKHLSRFAQMRHTDNPLGGDDALTAELCKAIQESQLQGEVDSDKEREVFVAIEQTAPHTRLTIKQSSVGGARESRSSSMMNQLIAAAAHSDSTTAQTTSGSEKANEVSTLADVALMQAGPPRVVSNGTGVSTPTPISTPITQRSRVSKRKDDSSAPVSRKRKANALAGLQSMVEQFVENQRVSQQQHRELLKMLLSGEEFKKSPAVSATLTAMLNTNSDSTEKTAVLLTSLMALLIDRTEDDTTEEDDS